jgi:hypothetical protein
MWADLGLNEGNGIFTRAGYGPKFGPDDVNSEVASHIDILWRKRP